MTFSALKIIATSLKRFNDDKCWNASIVISYFALLCAVPVVALFAYITTRVLGDTELAFRSLNIFTEEFFASLDPSFKKIQGLSQNTATWGSSAFTGPWHPPAFFSNLISSINTIFATTFVRLQPPDGIPHHVRHRYIMFFSLSITAV